MPSSYSDGNKKDKNPRLSIAIIWNWEPLWMESFGSTDTTGNKKVTNKTIFSIQSLSKSITTVAILTTVQDGLLDLDIPINKYLPNYALFSRFEEHPQDKITSRHLLCHRAGLAHNLPDEVLEKIYNKNALKILAMFKG